MKKDLSSGVTVSYEILSSKNTDIDITDEFYPYDLREIKFLEEFAKDLDPRRAAKDAGYKSSGAGKLLMGKEHIKKECYNIYQARLKAINMTAEMASSRHIELMQKIENDYNKCETLEPVEELTTKAKFASSLSKFSSDYLRAAGLFNDIGEKKAPNVVINIDLGNKIKEEIIEINTEDRKN